MMAKFQEIDLNLTKLFSILSESPNKDNTNNLPITKISNVIMSTKKPDELTTNTTTSSKINIDNFYKEFIELRSKIDEEFKILNNKTKTGKKIIKNEIIENEINDTNIINNNNVLNEIKPSDMNFLNNTSSPPSNQILKTINQLQENDKMVLQGLTHKVSRDELEKVQKQFAAELEKIVNFIFRIKLDYKN